MEKGRCGERYILGGENLNYKAIFDTICGVTSAPKVIIPLTKTLLYVYEKLTGVARKAGRITPMANPKILATSQEFFYFDSAKARTELGLKQTPFEQTVQKAFTWYKQNGLL
jgi:dihydroflavonol-4-reductase